MSYYRRDDNPTSHVLCDRCGFVKHHRPSRPDDPAVIVVDDAPAWSWAPQDSWCWAPTWSIGFYPCAQCGNNANDHIPVADCAAFTMDRLFPHNDRALWLPTELMFMSNKGPKS